MRRQYLAINHGGNTKPHDGTRLVCLKKGSSLAKQNYVNLGTFFEIEAAYLEFWRGNVCLDDQSITRLENAFVEHLTDVTVRPSRRANAPLSPLDYRMPSVLAPQALGVADNRPMR